MAFKIGGKVEGLSGVLKALESIKRGVRTQILRGAVAKASRLLAKESKRRVDVKRSGQLKRSIGAKVKVYRGGLVAVGLVGPRKGFRVEYEGRPIDPVNYAHLIEFGTRPHGRHPGTAAHPFLRPAFEALKAALADLIAKECWAGIEKAARKKG